MADLKTSQLTALAATPAATDLLMVVDVSDTTMAASGTNKKLAASYVARSDAGAKLITGDGKELTVPATGTAALIGSTQTFSALQTLSAGLTFGGSTLSAFAEGTWSPDLQFGGAKVGITYATVAGHYVRIGKLVVASCNITLTNKGSSTGTAIVQDSSGILAAIGTPATVSPGPVRFSSMTTSLIGMTVEQSGTQFYLLGATGASTGYGTLAASDFANNTTIRFTVAYILT